MTFNSQKNVFIKYLLNLCAFLSLILGIIGAVIPGLPTTPFIILSLWIFSKSSDRFYKSLLSHKICGPPVKDYLEGRGIRKKYKIIALIFMWSSITLCIVISYSYSYGVLMLAILPLIASGVTYIIIRIPTMHEE